MPITHFKEVRPGTWPSHGKVKRVPYEIYTLEEADERGIEPVEHWREKLFHQGEDLSGKYVLTDDDPPLVTPIVGIRYDEGVDKQGRKIGKVHFPWTWTSSSLAKIKYGVKGFVHASSVKGKFNSTSRNSFRIFFLLVAIGADPKKVVECIWSVKQELEQEFLLRLLMGSEQAQSAASDLARDVFKDVGFGPKQVAAELRDLVRAKDTPHTVKADLIKEALTRMVVDDSKQGTQSSSVTGVYIGGASNPEQIHASVQRELARQIKHNTVVRALIEPPKEETPDG